MSFSWERSGIVRSDPRAKPFSLRYFVRRSDQISSMSSTLCESIRNRLSWVPSSAPIRSISCCEMFFFDTTSTDISPVSAFTENNSIQTLRASQTSEVICVTVWTRSLKSNTCVTRRLRLCSELSSDCFLSNTSAVGK